MTEAEIKSLLACEASESHGLHAGAAFIKVNPEQTRFFILS
jgi:hypothetical protein